MFFFQHPEFDPQKILAKSTAASGLCAWVINIYRFYNVYLIVGPKQKALRDAQAELKAAQEKMNYFNKKIMVTSQLVNISQTTKQIAKIFYSPPLLV